MGNPYWMYEPIMFGTQCVSIRQSGVNNFGDDYYLFLGKFVSKYGNQILKISTPNKLYDGSLVCVIHLKNGTNVEFENQNENQ